MLISDRDIRQRELIPPEKLANTTVTVVGTGAIGRQVALQLAAIGVPHLALVDFDTVGPENLAPQGFLETDIGKTKVDVTASLCGQLNSNITIEPNPEKFRAIGFHGGVLMCCVDKIDIRRHIFDSVINRTSLFVDGRMSAEYLRVLTVSDDASKEYYPTTLFASSEAYRGSCTSKSTIYCANIAAAIMVSQFTKWLRGLELDKDIDLNLLTNEMGVK